MKEESNSFSRDVAIDDIQNNEKTSRSADNMAFFIATLPLANHDAKIGTSTYDKIGIFTKSKPNYKLETTSTMESPNAT